MRRHLIGLLSATGFAILAGCFSSSTGDETESGTGAATAGDLDDSFATSVLAGGCSVVVDGSEGKTAGSGGKCPTKLSTIMDAMDTLGSTVFVVSEKADRPDDPDSSFRFVVSAKSNNLPVFIATLGTGNLGEDGVEAIGFSPKLQAFAYYKVERGSWVRKGDGSQVKSVTNGTDKPFECIGCHSTGAPLMKEIHDSWGNWTSTWDRVQAPKSSNALFKRLFDKVERADILETTIIDGIKLHSKGRVDRAKKEGKLNGVLAQLMCEIGEPSIVGAHSKNSARLGKINTFSSMLPGAIMINQLLIPPRTGGTGVELGLEQSVKLNAPSVQSLRVEAGAYAKALEDNKQKIGGQPGDAIFPMSSPEKSHADLDAVQELLRQNLIDNEIVADVLMTDFTVSAFSKIRCDLASTIPATWSNAEDLKKTWGAALSSSSLRGAKGLAARLGKKDIEEHSAKLEAFGKACAARAPAEFTPDVVKIISQRRLEFTERYHSVVESEWLIPTDSAGSRIGAKRLNATTCTLEDQSAKFDGE